MPAKEVLDLSKLDFTSFTKTINQSYSCEKHEGEPLILTEVVELFKPNDSRVKRKPFVLVFKAPKSFPIQQDIYQLANDEIGHLALFLVPVSNSEDHVMLEATFT
jgi:hypothetical protein